MMASPAMAPITMPAMVPPERELELEAAGAAAALVLGEEEAAAGVGEADELEVELAAELKVEEVFVALDVVLDESVPPRT